MAAPSRGLTTTAVVVGIALAVAVLSVWVWPSAQSGAGEAQLETGAVDVTAPVGRIGRNTTGPNTGGATDHPIVVAESGVEDDSGWPETDSISGPVGGLEAARGVPSEAGGVADSTLGAGTGVGRATPTAARGR